MRKTIELDTSICTNLCSYHTRGCTVIEPFTIEGNPCRQGKDLENHLGCRHYTCKVGLWEASEALQTETPINVVVDGKLYLAVPFGSDDKPFDVCPRYVIAQGDDRGRIITTRLDGRNYLSAAKIKTWK